MAAYGEIAGATSHSDLVSQMHGQHAAMRAHERSANSGAPSVLLPGLLWWRTDHPTYGICLMYCDGAAWIPLLKLGTAPALMADGSVVATDDLDMGGKKVVGAADGEAAGELLAFGQALLLGGGTMAGVINMDGRKIIGLAAATANGDALRFQDKWPDTCGVHKSINPVQVAQAADDAGTFQEVLGGKVTTFTPRILHIWIAGHVTLQAGGGIMIPSTNTKILNVVRFSGDADPLTVGSMTSGGTTVNVEIEWKYTAPRGFWIRLKRASDGAYCDAAVAVEAQFGVGQ